MTTWAWMVLKFCTGGMNDNLDKVQLMIHKRHYWTNLIQLMAVL